MQEKKTNWLGVVIAVALVALILFGVWLINENINQPRVDTNYFDTEENKEESIDISDNLDDNLNSEDSTASILDASEENTDTQDSKISQEKADSESKEASQKEEEAETALTTEESKEADATDQEESTKKSNSSLEGEEEEEGSEGGSVNTKNLKSNQIIAKVYSVEEDKAKFEIIDCGVEDANYCVKGNTFSTTGSASEVEDGATYLLTADIEDPGSGNDFSLSNVKVQRQ